MNSNTSPLKDECVDPMCACRGGPCAECPVGDAAARNVEVRSLRSQELPHPSEASAGEFDRAAELVDSVKHTETNGETLGLVLKYRLAVIEADRLRCASPPSQSIASDVVAATWTNEQIDQIDVLAEGMLKKMVAAPDVLSRQSPVEADSTEYCWLVELRGPLVKRPSYHTGFTTLDGESRSTIDPHKAKRYLSQGAAQTVAEKLGFNLVGTWHAVEHGFHSAVAASPSPVEADTQRSE